ncbi:extracellular matrix protein 1 [Aythya fuligula]|uniref:Extracellular matrix protein 1 n=1 Tax=Aythya fuligula TaxID=219594 RepID=A0A6J3E918_AYTFU|nr:extracellular matrix protein 1 [Aythya fuligula]
MAAFGLLLLLLLGTAAALKPRHPVVQEQLIPQHPYDIEQVMQEEQDIELPPGVMDAAKNPPRPRAPSSPDSVDAFGASSWGSTLEGFPPAWPLPDALARHCRAPTLLPRAPRPSLPPAAFAHLRRQVEALDAFWPRLDGCCRRPAPLPCARRAWTDVLDTFCDDEFGVKTRQFHCCRRHGAARRRCFTDATAAATAATHVTQVTEVTVWDVAHEPSFPPGEPTAANMDNICRLRGLRPGPRGLPGPRARFHTRLERDFGRCCNNGTGLECARAAWQKGLDRYCREEGAVKMGQHRCCQRGGGSCPQPLLRRRRPPPCLRPRAAQRQPGPAGPRHAAHPLWPHQAAQQETAGTGAAGGRHLLLLRVAPRGAKPLRGGTAVPKHRRALRLLAGPPGLLLAGGPRTAPLLRRALPGGGPLGRRRAPPGPRPPPVGPRGNKRTRGLNLLPGGSRVFMGHQYGTPVWDTSMGYQYETPVWNTSKGHWYGTPVQDTSLGHQYKTPVLDTSMGYQ